MKLLRLGPALAIGVSLLIQPVFADVKATDIFETIPGTQAGSCGGKDLDMMVQEAITLNTKAIKALETLLSKDLFSWFGDESRLAWAAEGIWGAWRTPGVGLRGIGYRFNDAGKATLRKAKENYEKANKKLESNSRADGGKLVCGAGDWESVKTWQDLGWDAEYVEKKFSKPNDRRFPDGGFYYSKKWAKRDDQNRVQLEESIVIPGIVKGREKAPCSGNQCAFMLQRGKLITMCDLAFREDTLADLFAKQGSWAKGKSVDSLKTSGTIFQHEMMHYIDKTITDMTVQGKNAYGWGNLCLLAQQSGQNPLNNAQSYTTFAVLVAFDRTKWDDEGKKI